VLPTDPAGKGQVVFAALADVLKSRIAAAVPVTGNGAGPVPRLLGFGDLVVLVNPALEASVYHSIDDLTRRKVYSNQQTPILMVVSSEGDSANKRLFPLGRWFSVLSEPYGNSAQHSQKIHALGWEETQITHCLALTNGQACSGFRDVHVPQKQKMGARELSSSRPAASQGALDNEAMLNAGAWDEEDQANPEQIHLAGELGMAGTRFYRIDDFIDQK
jgi:hypothetical protein